MSAFLRLVLEKAIIIAIFSYKYTYFDLETPLNANVGNNDRQTKDNYRFTVDNSSEANPIDWYNAYLEVDFQLVTTADSATGIITGPNNGNPDCTTTKRLYPNQRN